MSVGACGTGAGQPRGLTTLPLTAWNNEEIMTKKRVGKSPPSFYITNIQTVPSSSNGIVKVVVQRNEVLPLFRDVVLSKDSGHRANRLASGTINAFFRVDVEHCLALIDTVHGANVNA
jgi:hypothetical protein